MARPADPPLRGAFLGLLLLGLASPTPGSAGQGEELAPASAVEGPLAARIDLYLARLVPFGFSGAVVLERGGQRLLARGYGYADEADGVPNTPQTLFPIDSLSKQFTAAAILVLEMRGLLGTEDTLVTFFENVPPDKGDITLHQLLTHTSGVMTGTTTRIDDASREGVLEAVFEAPLLFPPGTRDAYSNLGYAVLAAVVETVSGQDFGTFLREALFLPAGMESTGLGFDDLGPRVVAHRYAGGVDQGSSLDRGDLDWNHVGSGGILASADDLLRWHRALLGDEILSPRAKEKLTTPVRNEYAYGWFVQSTAHGRLMLHDGGSSRGSACEMRRYLDAGVTLILLSNRDGEEMLFGNRLARRLPELAFGQELVPAPEVAAVDPERLEGIAGRYDLADGARVDLVLESGRPVLRGRGQAAVEALLTLEEPERARATNREAEALLDPLEGLQRNGLLDAIARRVSEAEATLGHLRGHEVLGTTPDWVSGFGDWMTFVELDLERGKQLFRLHWKDGEVLATGGGGIPEPAEVWFGPGPEEGDFLGFHLPTGRRPTLRLPRDAEGRGLHLDFGGGFRATRGPGPR